MTIEFLGIFSAFVACFSWGFGDYFIQKVSRHIGSWSTMFWVSVAGVVGLFPFILKNLAHLTWQEITLLLLLGFVFFFTSLFDFEALRSGKIAIVEPVISLELPLTILLGMIFLGETSTLLQKLLFLGIFAGIVCSITTHVRHFKRYTRIFEKGFILAGVGAIGMGLSNFLVGFSSKNIDPLLTMWFTSLFIAIGCFIILKYRKQFSQTIQGAKKHFKIVLPLVILDNLGWIGYAISTSVTQIGFTTSISESYIIVASLLGIIINKEKLKTHQIIGIIISIGCIMILATTI